ncbi:apses-domain-containing protein [Aulographum hederae CBS 113979]|uniref:Apses-domain-containing protein n=1 Tax=Aulographum hederae CBS 113979 TaxID=1176131 RepID=A0A6G1GQI8_9PEZI|nr:apses-domain-containing protein [Aulographum hederae CBS 113979]
MPPLNDGKIYSATYSNVPVYEYNVEGNHVMRRRADDWINATHILKVADFDKPARTRILEREVQKGVHEKVQGGYGKYQGTWVPLHDGRHLAERNGVLAKLQLIFDFVPGDRSPPPAPKHATAASSKPRAPRQSAATRKSQAQGIAASQQSEDRFEVASTQFEDETPDNATVVSESFVDEDSFPQQYPGAGGRKRKRGQESNGQDQQHQIWADSLLDYFMLLDSEDRFPVAPEPPPTVNLDRAIDDKGHTALHWAAAMGDVDVVKDLIGRGARQDSTSNNLETPLMRAGMFTNNYDKDTMSKIVRLLNSTVHKTDWFGSTVFHHIAATTSSKNKYLAARYYFDSIINTLAETWRPDEITRLLNSQDQNGDTAIHIAARNGARKCVRSLLGRNVAVDIANQDHETAEDLIRDLNARRRERGGMRHASSSPFAPDAHFRMANGGAPPLGHATAESLYANLSMGSMSHELKSTTANNLVKTLLPSLFSKITDIAQSYDSELELKLADAAEAERVVRRREIELETTRKQIRELGDIGLEEPDVLQDPNGVIEEVDPVDSAMDRELDGLVAETEGLLEWEQSGIIGSLVEREEALAKHAEKMDAQQNAQMNGLNGVHGVASPEEKKGLLVALYQAQQDRRVLVREIVKGLAQAGESERQADYRRLITGAMGVRDEDVEGLLPEILKELEEAKVMRGMEEGDEMVD